MVLLHSSPCPPNKKCKPQGPARLRPLAASLRTHAGTRRAPCTQAPRGMRENETTVQKWKILSFMAMAIGVGRDGSKRQRRAA